MPVLDDDLTRRQLAIELNVHEKTVERWEHLPDGLPSLKLGQRRFYRRQSVLAWIEARERKPNQRRVMNRRSHAAERDATREVA